MKAIAIILLSLASFMPCAVLAGDIDEVVTSMRSALPQGWQVRVDNNNLPPWTRGEDRCIRLDLYGSALGGYRYLNASGKPIAEKMLAHECITIWVTSKGFNDGWNFVTNFLHRLMPWAIEFPSSIGQRHGVHVYAQESYFWLHEEWREPSPKGTVTAIFHPPPEGRTWKGWIDDLRRALKN